MSRAQRWPTDTGPRQCEDLQVRAWLDSPHRSDHGLGQLGLTSAPLADTSRTQTLALRRTSIHPAPGWIPSCPVLRYSALCAMSMCAAVGAPPSAGTSGSSL